VTSSRWNRPRVRIPWCLLRAEVVV
jgi:hypothetical protein